MESPAIGRRSFLVGSAGLAALASLGACSPSPGAGGSSSGVNSIVTAWPLDIATMDPATASTDQDKELTLNVYQRLLEYKWTQDTDGSYVWAGLDSVGSLAQSWEMNGTSAVFHLRTDVKFYPTGNPLTAEDFRWSVERCLALAGSDFRNGGIYNASQVVVVDDHTVTINFTDVSGTPAPATPTLLATMRMPCSGVVDSVEAKKHATPGDPYAEKWLVSNVAGTGPYYVKSRSIGQQIDLAVVPGSRSPAPAMTSVTVRVTQSGSVSSLLRGGSLNVGLFGLSPNDIKDLKTAGFAAVHKATPDFVFIQMAEGTGPFADQRVRQAVAYAIPYEDIVNNVYFGLAERSLSYVNVKAAGYTPAWGKYSTNMDRAKSLIKEAGNPTFTVPFRYNNAEPAYEDMARLIQDAVKNLGITLTLTPMPKAHLTANVQTRAKSKPGAQTTNDIVMNNLSIYIDDPKSPVSFYSHTGATNNYPLFSNPTVDSLADQNQYGALTADRASAYQKIQQIVADDASFLPLVVTGRTVVLAKGITGTCFTPEIGVRFWTLEPK
jgi:peptide/nickel transport system substrate-binding protein